MVLSIRRPPKRIAGRSVPPHRYGRKKPTVAERQIMVALRREQLDTLGCGTTNCNHDHSVLYINGACHPSEGISARYVKATGVIEFICSKCEKHITTVSVEP